MSKSVKKSLKPVKKSNKLKPVTKSVDKSEVKENQEALNQDVQKDENLIIAYKNTIALAEVSGRVPAWANVVSVYGCEIFKRQLTKGELEVLSDSIKGFSSFFTAINERLTQINSENK